MIDDFSCVIQRGDKLGLIGPNGCGKTTLLKLILGELTPDSGTVRAGTRLAVAYFDQFRSQPARNPLINRGKLFKQPEPLLYGCAGKMNALIPNGSLVVHA